MNAADVDSEVTLVEFLTDHSHGIDPQKLMDSVLFATLSKIAHPSTPRIYEVVSDADGRLSVIWLTRSGREWVDLIAQSALSMLRDLGIGGA